MVELSIKEWIEKVEEEDVTTDELCTILGVTPNMVSRYRRGLNTPKLSTAVDIYTTITFSSCYNFC